MSNIKFRISALTDEGCVRKNNEDNFIVSTDLSSGIWTVDSSELTLGVLGSLLIVADGMGGMSAGEVASDIAIKSIQEQFNAMRLNEASLNKSIPDFLIQTIKVADRNILTYAEKNPETKGMGTTIVMAWIVGDVAHVAWCGDSRAYIHYPQLGLQQISKDHSYVQELVNKGIITSEQAFYHPDSNIITRSLGCNDKEAEPEVVSVQLYNGARLLLCSDGLNSMLADEIIDGLITNNNDIRKCSEELIENARNEGGHDNITVILCDIISGADSIKIPPQVVHPIHKSVTNSVKNKHSKTHIIVIVLLLLIIGAVFYFVKNYYSGTSIQSDPTTIVIPSKDVEPTDLNTLETADEKVDTSHSIKSETRQKVTVPQLKPEVKSETGNNTVTTTQPVSSDLTPIKSKSQTNLTPVEKVETEDFHD